MKTAALSWLPVKPLPSHVVLEVVWQVQCQGGDVMKWQEIGEVGGLVRLARLVRLVDW